jgi:hypothetical protein
VLVAYLLASPEFALIDGAPMPSMEPFGLLDGLPVKVLEEAREWERHIMEVETGSPPNSLPGATPRAGFDPGNTTIAERDQAKAAELAGLVVCARVTRTDPEGVAAMATALVLHQPPGDQHRSIGQVRP